MPILPRYPVYVPSKSRFATCYTARLLDRDGVPYSLVVEPSEAAEYAQRFASARLLVLPRDQMGLMAARNWIKEHSTAAGDVRHWQLDDNISRVFRKFKRKRLPCVAGPALAAVEDFTDRYENIAVSGPAYYMFGMDGAPAVRIYQGDGRLKMARSLERLWPGVVKVRRRFGRPQHVVNWRKFTTPLKLKEGIDLALLTPNEYGLTLTTRERLSKKRAEA